MPAMRVFGKSGRREIAGRVAAIDDGGRGGRPSPVRLWSAHDSRTVGMLALMAAGTLLPEKTVEELARRHARRKAARPDRSAARLRDTVERFCAGGGHTGQTDLWVRQALVHRTLAQFLLLRQHLRPRHCPPVHLDGLDHLERARAAGRGAVLWVLPTPYAPLFVKMALARAGHPLVHLSRWTHGFSNTRLGSALLNPIAQRMENRHLGERVVIAHGQAPTVAVRRLGRALTRNLPVSITMVPIGLECVETAFLGHRLRFAPGAPRLARSAGAPLLPVYCIRTDCGIEVRIDAPLAPPGAERHMEPQQAAREMAARLVDAFAAVPGQMLPVLQSLEVRP